MFRFSLLVCVSLIFGITAKPYKPWNKLRDEAIQNTVLSIDENGKMSWGMEVEPPEDMDATHYDIDPRMMIWTGQDKQPLKAEEDLDELDHPSVAELKVQIQNQDVLPAADVQAESSWENVNMKDNEDDPVFRKVAWDEPEQDWDDVYHKATEQLDEYLAPLAAGYNANAKLRVAHSEPEKDEDDLYHRDLEPSAVQMEPLRREVGRDEEVRVHLQPEEDMDDVYHRDLPISYQEDLKVATLVDLPSQRKHSEPEEDLDDLYHQ